MGTGSYRLVTRGDFDGVVCAALLREIGLVDEVAFAHPKDMQDGLVEIGANDIIANLPYVEGCHLAFDHHVSELSRLGEIPADRLINDPESPSAARVVFEHFGGAERFPNIAPELMDAVDRADSGRFSREDILEPTGWALLNFVLDARTGLGRFRDFTISNEQLLMEMIDLCRQQSIDEILLNHDVSERVRLYFEHEQNFRAQLERCGRLDGRCVVLDLREADIIYAGNRFMVYALFESANVSIHCLSGAKGNTVFALGKSVLDRSCAINLGELCLEFGGGGHDAAGTCQVDNREAHEVLAKLLDRLR